MQTVHPLMPLKTSKNMRESRENRWLTNTGNDLRPFGGRSAVTGRVVP